MANIKNENVKVKAKILDNDVTIKSSVGTKDVKVKSSISNVPSATTERKGIIRIATTEEVIDGTDNTTAITPYTLKNTVNTDKNFVFEQGIASDVWVIEHNLNKKATVTVVDTADEEQVPDRKVYDGLNKVTLYFLAEFAGKAYLN